MIRFFRKSYIVQYVVFGALALVLWAPTLVAGTAGAVLHSPVSPLFNLLAKGLSFSPYVLPIVAFLLLITEALVFNTIMAENQIVLKNSIIGAFSFFVIMSMTSAQMAFSPFLLACVFLLLMLGRLFKIYQSPKPELYLFDAGLLLAFATMCYFECVTLVIWMFVAIAVLRIGTFRTQLIPVLSFLSVYLMLFSIYYLAGVLPERLQQYVDFFNEISFDPSDFAIPDLIVLLVAAAVAFLPYLQSNNFTFEKSIAVRIKLSMVHVLLLFGIFLLFAGGNPLSHGLVFFVFAIILSYSLSYMDNLLWADVMSAFLLLLILSNQYIFKLV